MILPPGDEGSTGFCTPEYQLSSRVATSQLKEPRVYSLYIIISIYIKESFCEVFSETMYRRVMVDGFMDCAPNGECCRLCEVTYTQHFGLNTQFKIDLQAV